MNADFLESDNSYGKLYEKLKAIFDYSDKNELSIDSIEYDIYNVYPDMLSMANNDDRKNFVKECEVQITACYQRALERNYKMIRDHVDQSVTSHSNMIWWILTLDKEGNPCVCSVISVNKKGKPIYADGCTGIMIKNELQEVWNSRYKLNRWIDDCENLYELRAKALSLKEKGRLGLQSVPTPNYDTGGMSREQSDSQAWQNYAIENGMYRPVDYDASLEHLLNNIEKCIAFYEKAISMVSFIGNT